MEAGGCAAAAGSPGTPSCGRTLCSAACALLTGRRPCRGSVSFGQQLLLSAMPALRGGFGLALGAQPGSGPGCEVWGSARAPKSSIDKYADGALCVAYTTVKMSVWELVPISLPRALLIWSRINHLMKGNRNFVITRGDIV